MMEVEEDGGYGEDFLEELHSRYECPICCLVLREPLQLQCGHRFCQTCFEKLPKRYRSVYYFHLQPLAFNQFHLDLNWRLFCILLLISIGITIVMPIMFSQLIKMIGNKAELIKARKQEGNYKESYFGKSGLTKESNKEAMVSLFIFGFQDNILLTDIQGIIFVWNWWTLSWSFAVKPWKLLFYMTLLMSLSKEQRGETKSPVWFLTIFVTIQMLIYHAGLAFCKDLGIHYIVFFILNLEKWRK